MSLNFKHFKINKMDLKSAYQCQFCSYFGPAAQTYHYFVHHATRKEILREKAKNKCNFCKFSTLRQRNLFEHKLQKHKCVDARCRSQLWTCSKSPGCGFTSFLKYKMKIHENSKHEDEERSLKRQEEKVAKVFYLEFASKLT